MALSQSALNELLEAIAQRAGCQYMDESSDGEAEFGRVETYFIAFEDAFLFKLAHSFKHTRGCHLQSPGELGIGDFPIVLNYIQNMEINSV